MTSGKRAGALVLGVAGWLVSAQAFGAAGAVAVSPGAGAGAGAGAEAVASEVAGGCPTFSWSPAGSGMASELAVLELGAEGDLESAQVVLRRQVAAGASSWTPGRAECLASGREYAWVVRAAGPDSEWSAPLYFRVASAPSEQELADALTLLKHWRADREYGASGSGGARAAAPAEARQLSGRDARWPRAPLVGGASAIHGEMPDTSGAAFGVFGVSHSAQGAGLVGRNETTGADLVLDGAAQGEADTLFTQAGIDRPSGSPQTFDVQNSGAGAMTLRVDGVAVDTATTPIDWTRLASVPAGFADGIDNDSGGDITDVSAGSGLSGGGSSGAVTLAASFGGSGAATTVSRSDHDHLGQNWIGSTGLEVSVSTEGFPAFLGLATTTSGQGIGVYGGSLSTVGIGVYGHAPAPGRAGHFSGNVTVSGTLSKGAGSFKIDHPLDPGNKYLYHSFVESPDMMNVYNGNVTTGETGYATVELPDWFEALNRDFRYQLTVLDEGDGAGFVRAKVVGKIADNRFTLRTSAPRTEVSWQVTGIRQDPFAERNRIPVEQEKHAAERGLYLHPEAWGRPPEAGIDDRERLLDRQREHAEPARDPPAPE